MNRQTYYLVLSSLFVGVFCIFPFTFHHWSTFGSTTGLNINGPWIFEFFLILMQIGTIFSSSMLNMIGAIATLLWAIPFALFVLAIVNFIMHQEMAQFQNMSLAVRLCYYYGFIYLLIATYFKYNIANLGGSILDAITGSTLSSTMTLGFGFWAVFLGSIYATMLMKPTYTYRQMYAFMISALLCLGCLAPWIFAGTGSSGIGANVSFSLLDLGFVGISMLITCILNSVMNSGLIIGSIVLSILLLLPAFNFYILDRIITKRGTNQGKMLWLDGLIMAIFSLVFAFIVLLVHLWITQNSHTTVNLSVGGGLLLTLVVSLVEIFLLRTFCKNLSESKAVPTLFVKILNPTCTVSLAHFYKVKKETTKTTPSSSVFNQRY